MAAVTAVDSMVAGSVGARSPEAEAIMAVDGAEVVVIHQDAGIPLAAVTTERVGIPAGEVITTHAVITVGVAATTRTAATAAEATTAVAVGTDTAGVPEFIPAITATTIHTPIAIHTQTHMGVLRTRRTRTDIHLTEIGPQTPSGHRELADGHPLVVRSVSPSHSLAQWLEATKDLVRRAVHPRISALDLSSRRIQGFLKSR